jgi:hypothetical protein
MSEKKQATEKKADVKAQAASGKEARKEAKAAETKTAEPVAPKAAEPTTKEVSIYKLTEKATTEFEKMKGQRKLMTAAFIKAGKPVAAHDLQPFFEDITALTKQDPQAVINYHCEKMLDDGYLVETGKTTIEVPKRQRKVKETSAAPAAETPAPAQA